MKKGILFLNILIQISWYIAAGTATYLMTKNWLSGLIQPWRTIVGALVFVAIVCLIMLIRRIIQATKDPDVIDAANLRIDIRNYKQYREWYDEHQRLMMKYGIESKEAQQYFLYFFKQIKNPNEWRRYSLYRQKNLE